MPADSMKAMGSHTVQRLRRAGAALLLALPVATTTAVGAQAPASAAAVPTPTFAWEQSVGGIIRESSPEVGTLDGGGPSVLVGAWDGKLYAFHLSNGSAPAGWPAVTSTGINSSPAIADTNGDGRAEVFVGSGLYTDTTRGALYSFTNTGQQRFRNAEITPGAATPSGLSEAPIQAGPTIGDITHDGVADVVSPALGLKAYAYTESGALLSGWPYYTDDSVFSTPALADVNGDGKTDVVFGGDSTAGGFIDHQGGVLRALDGSGAVLWQHFTSDMVRGGPAIGDIDGSGRPGVVFGGGDYWYRTTGPNPDATRVTSVNLNNGQTRWSRDLGGVTNASPALADVDGDGRLDVIEGTSDLPGQGGTGGRIFVLNGADGTPKAQFNGRIVGSPGPAAGTIIGGITTADLTGGGYQSLLVPTGAGVFAYDGRSGALLWSLKGGQAGYQNSPVVTDEGGGVLGITIAGSTPQNVGIVTHYRLRTGGGLGSLAWPTFHKDARHTGSWTNPPLTQTFCPPVPTVSYWLAARDGGIFSFCGPFFGSAGAAPLNQPIVGMAKTPSGNGYWLVASDGGVFSYGDAPYLGSTGNVRLNQPIVGMAPTRTGRGYWLVAADGGIFTFGDAAYLGSTGGTHLNQPIVGMAAVPGGGGYWLVARDGGIFTFGTAAYLGSTGGTRLNQPIVGMAAVPGGGGYWLVASDGGIFTFGTAPYLGSTGAVRLNQPIVGMASTPGGGGYWLVASDGGIFTFGNAPYLGSTGGIHLNQPIVGMAAR